MKWTLTWIIVLMLMRGFRRLQAFFAPVPVLTPESYQDKLLPPSPGWVASTRQCCFGPTGDPALPTGHLRPHRAWRPAEATNSLLWDCLHELQLWHERGRPLQKLGLESIGTPSACESRNCFALRNAVDILPGNFHRLNHLQVADQTGRGACLREIWILFRIWQRGQRRWRDPSTEAVARSSHQGGSRLPGTGWEQYLPSLHLVAPHVVVTARVGAGFAGSRAVKRSKPT